MVLLLEDDCAPDAREYFEKRLLEKFGLTMKDFFEKGEKIEFGYKLGEYKLEYFPDDPYWRLSGLA